MRVSFDIKCSDYTHQPAYRVWINGELMAERDFIIPSNEFSHYKFSTNLACDSAHINIESIMQDVVFTYDNLELTNED